MAEHDLKEKLLRNTLPHVPFDGWSDVSLRHGAEMAGMTLAEAHMLFPAGAEGLLDYFMDTLDAQMIEALQKQPLAEMKVHQKVRFALLARFEAASRHREAVRRALTYYALPFHSHKGLKRLYKTVDAIWRAAGDTSTDHNFYTKRMTLAGVYSATLLYWLNDESSNHEATIAFLDKRLADVLTFHKTKLRVKEAFRSPFRRTV